jgi:lipoyl-dependent peroxiredoxin
MALEQVTYTAHATAVGGRDGVAKSDDGKLDVKFGLPPEMGGKSEGTNPEQLFAAGYAACFIGALKFVATSQKIRIADNVEIKSDVSLGALGDGAKGFGIAVTLQVHVPDMERSEAERLVREAHEVCPYSNATRGNVDVQLSVV